ncbi:hypothetical protein GCM10022243_50500 [Saccharothrix violaceirubra]|uniref:NACHT domain-containing protein n=1 Tax=Saccharothrix violaceirubra TaxID=413306 RepID=A0A7W7SZ53_9PSEU|nr:hypothetical protein [Saccharothrix violaceirubra]MBB4963608.1 hypothetical protein [Saccharothrix violaceirubra]
MESAAARLTEELRDLHLRAGAPSMRTLASSADMSHTSAHDALNGKRLPSWSVVANLVRALDGDVDYFRDLWNRANAPSDDLVPLYLRQEANRLRRLLGVDLMPLRVDGPYGPEVLDDFDEQLRRALFIGEPGSGNFTLLLVFARGLMKRTVDHVPFVVSLARFGDEYPPHRSIAGFVEHHVRTVNQLDVPDGWVSGLFASGRALVLFDGLSKVPDERRARIAEVVENFVLRYPDLRVALTLRPRDVGLIDEKMFAHYRMLPPETRDVDRYCDRERVPVPAPDELLITPGLVVEAVRDARRGQPWGHCATVEAYLRTVLADMITDDTVLALAALASARTEFRRAPAVAMLREVLGDYAVAQDLFDACVQYLLLGDGEGTYWFTTPAVHSYLVAVRLVAHAADVEDLVVSGPQVRRFVFELADRRWPDGAELLREALTRTDASQGKRPG